MIRSRAALAKEATRKPREVPLILYVPVTQVSGSTVKVDVDGVIYPVPYSRCFGCGGTPPSPGDTVAVHLNGTEVAILGTHL